MANFFEESIRFYSGLSSETKPTAAGGTTVPNGSRWREVDTGKIWFYNQGDDTWYLTAPTFDAATHAQTTIDYAHHEVHSGSFYRTGMNYILANGDVATFGLTTPDTTKWLHMAWELSATADGTFALLEDVTSFSGGAAVTPINHNRNSLNTSGATCIRGMTGVNLITPTGGTGILSATLATGKGNIMERGVAEEFILKQDSNYLFRYTNGTSANTILLALSWYEHTNKA